MYGHGANNNKLTIHPGENPGFFRGCDRGRWNRGRGRGKSYFHALCGNCKENLAKTRLKTEISRKTRKFLPKNLHKAKICRTFAMSKRKTNKTQNQNEKNENDN